MKKLLNMLIFIGKNLLVVFICFIPLLIFSLLCAIFILPEMIRACGFIITLGCAFLIGLCTPLEEWADYKEIIK